MADLFISCFSALTVDVDFAVDLVCQANDEILLAKVLNLSHQFLRQLSGANPDSHFPEAREIK